MTDESGRIAVADLTKVFGSVRAVDNLSFTVAPGTVTGFLGPNGAGKTTTLRCLLGLVTPTAGTATIGGLRYADLPRPSGTVGAVLDASSFHPARTARNHLRVLCAANGYPVQRGDEVLTLVGLTPAAGRKVNEYSAGMRQRLGLAAALLGDPQVLLLDEPANGLDPEGIVWLRRFLRRMASEGRTILLSSHVLSEVEQTVDDVVIIDKGSLVGQGGLAELADGQGRPVVVRGPDLDRLAATLHNRAGLTHRDGALVVTGLRREEVGHIAFSERIELHELTTERSDLKDIFFALTGGGASR
ncbi:ABC-2 type transport system ATP-binding protein [Kribbella orskensis]|uniref:ABC-2 type transport system ATP-binding protein n=1 Tax=Kribbella orskensis TaxID=2512216 RepID=A0ABY2BAG6_9ACTN|nr:MULTISPECIES: ATP-binding cassette domain-containing protein [Kribbella]TCN31127.1 ABC-2 type transport system ATP-binding protein [Kribbella sp. VKM Ac-2500]TCO11633.1 ABC-2 type transport system ATP-binding protein [Kribbella orskensis]